MPVQAAGQPGRPGPGGGSRPTLPGGGRTLDDRFFVAFYGAPRTGVLGVLGERPVAESHRRLVRAAAPFRRPGERLQPVHELIVTVADPFPGPRGTFHHDVARADVARHVAAARRLGALVVLDLQPGRSGFLPVARRWAWALRQPHVGLALDPEWRVGPRQVPGQVIGSVRADEVNRVAAWLGRLVEREDLPEKLFVLHQFRTTMLPDLGRVRPVRGLEMVQHVDGFGTPGQKLDTYREVLSPDRFAPGFKLFYDEDRPLMTPAAVRRVRPAVRFVSYQ